MAHDHGHGGHDHASMMNHADPSATASTPPPVMVHDHANGHHGNHPMETINGSGHQDHNMNMHMYFHGGEKETILFQFWKISETGGLIASMIAIFFLAFIYEALKFYREHLYRHSFQTVQVNTVALPVENGGAIKETHKTVQIPNTSSSPTPYTLEVNPIIITQGNCSCPTSVPEEKVDNNKGTSLTSSDRPASSSPKTHALHYKVRMLSWMHGWQTVLHVLQVVLSYFLMLIFMTYNVWLCLAVAFGAGAGYFFFGWKKSLVVDITEHCH